MKIPIARSGVVRMALRGAVVGALVCLAAPSRADTHRAAACAEPGRWLNPKTGDAIMATALFERLAARRVVLLGEIHTDAEHHAWQADTLAGLRARHAPLVLALEMFPRAARRPLDAWVRGDLSREAFLEQTDWRRVWGYDAALYMPVFDMARRNRIAMRGVNVARSLVARVGREGWKAIPVAARAGLSDPAAPSEAYRRSLAKVFREKARRGVARAGDNAPTDAPVINEILEMPSFARFAAAQSVWDRAMAEGIAAALEERPGALVVGLMGRGHVEMGWGVPHQLADLGIASVAILLPVTAGAECRDIDPASADALFVLAPAKPTERRAPWKPRLGIAIEAAGGGVRLLRVQPDSVAAAAKLRAGDVILSAAGRRLRETRDLSGVVGRQAPGAWLPLAVLRDGAVFPVIAKFPTVPADEPAK